MCCSYYRNAVASISVFSSANLNGFCEEGGDAIGNARTKDFLQLLDVALVSVTPISDPNTDLITHTQRNSALDRNHTRIRQYSNININKQTCPKVCAPLHISQATVVCFLNENTFFNVIVYIFFGM